MFALVVGIVLVPFSILGTLFLMGLGLLGLAPFAMAYVYARRAAEAFRATKQYPLARRVTAAAVGFVMPALAALVVNVLAIRAYESAVVDVLGGGNRKVHRAVFRLQFLQYCVALDDMAWRYSREADPERRERLASAYREVTGDPIDGLLHGSWIETPRFERPNKRMQLTKRGLRLEGRYPDAPFLTESRFAADARCYVDFVSLVR